MADRTCTIEGCAAKMLARGWCNRHYLRWKAHGDPLGGGPNLRKVVDFADGTRICTVCEQRLPIAQFDEDQNGSAGRRSHCKSCRSARMKDWYSANQERIRRRMQDHRDNNPEVVRANDLARYERHRDKRIALARIAVDRRRVRMAGGAYEPGISVETLRGIHGDVCPYCGVLMRFVAAIGREFVATKATIEHVVPLSRGGGHTFENTMLCCWQCNVRKNAKPLEEWIANGREALREDGASALDQAS